MGKKAKRARRENRKAAEWLLKVHNEPRPQPACPPGPPNILGMRMLPAEPVGREEVTWSITLAGGGTVVLTTAELLSYKRFCRACSQQLDVEFCPMEINAWRGLLNQALRPLREGPP
jgi:hypothetical protein